MEPLAAKKVYSRAPDMRMASGGVPPASMAVIFSGGLPEMPISSIFKPGWRSPASRNSFLKVISSMREIG